MRNPSRIRPCKITLGEVYNVSGSAYLEMGETKVFATVRGPFPANRNFHPHRGTIHCNYEMASFGQLSKRRFNRRSIELSRKIEQAFETVIDLSRYVGQEIFLDVQIISAGGSTRCAAISALSVALVHAGIEVYSLVPAISFGKFEDQILLDLDTYEDNNGEADFAVAYDPFNQRYLLQQMDGFLTFEELNRGLDLSRRGLFYIYYVQKRAIVDHYEEYFNNDKEQLYLEILLEGQRLFNLDMFSIEDLSEQIEEISSEVEEQRR